jgi:preprotein translocase subunit SecA
MLKKLFQGLGGDPNKKIIEKYSVTVDKINALEATYEALSDSDLSQQTKIFKDRLAEGETLNDLLPEAFAVVREASKRTIGLRHYDVQLIGGMILHSGQVAEMRTGEGKTLVATLPIYLNALPGKGVHLITVNDYLARRDARWMAPIFDFLNLSVGVLQMGSRTEGGKKAFLVDLQKESSIEDQHQLVMVDRAKAYQADVTYGTNSEFGFDYLRDNMRMSLNQRSQRGHHYAIIDEVDNVLIDEARTPLIISGPSFDDAETYIEMASVVKRLRPEDYEVNEKDRNVALTEIGETRVEELLGQPLRDPERPEDITPEQARLMGFLEQAMRAQYLFKRNKDYIVQSGQVIIVDEFTGRMMPGRRWSDGLHQAVEAKEGVRVQSENITHATITIQNYFRMYTKLSGMTGTAMTEAEEFSKIYDLECVALPSNVEYMASREDAPIIQRKAKDEYDYEFTYYSLVDDPEELPYLWKRKDYPDVVYRTEEAKLRSIVREIIQYHCVGRPTLVGTTSVEKSELLSQRLKAGSIQKLIQTLLLRYKWLEKNNREEDGRLIMALTSLNEPLDNLNTTEMRNFARELDVSLNPSNESNLKFLANHVFSLEEKHLERLKNVIQGGVPHDVLNARKHTEESQIIAGAGRIGAVTIATNMAGRGVDIKLGGEIREELIAIINRVLKRAGVDDPFDLNLEEKLAELKNIPENEYSIYADQINEFIELMGGMEEVKNLGGLHVIGSERHEARRIDNQLRGRSARQGDPGSSRFYLSMEDDLMRLFGGQQMDGMMQRLGMDEQLPLELNLVTRIIESAQTRVEGANFDSREHLLEYDDVLNSQRQTIYNQRDRIFIKKDLSEDVLEMLENEISSRVPTAISDEESPWRLLSWLDQIQPSFLLGNIYFPSFSKKILLDELKKQPLETPNDAVDAIANLADRSITAQKDHLLLSAESSIEWYENNLEDQLNDRLESVDAFFETLHYADETDQRAGKELMDELSSLVRLPIRFSNNEQRLFYEDPDTAEDMVRDQVESALTTQVLIRLIGAIDRRLPEDLSLTPSDLNGNDWDDITETIINQIDDIYERRRERFLSEDQAGSLIKQLKDIFNGAQGKVSDGALLQAMVAITHEKVTSFDQKTHRRIRIGKERFSYLYFAAQLVNDLTAEEITDQVLDHLRKAYQINIRVWGSEVWRQISHQVKLLELPENARKSISSKLKESTLNSYKDLPLNQYPPEERDVLIVELGRNELTEAYRKLILRVISELWIDYLTKMEALRISIGLEAYAQRDPLVAYKTQASEMFQKLFQDMQSSVVHKMFTYRPRPTATSNEIQASEKPSAPKPEPVSEPQKTKVVDQPKKKKRRRRR